MSEWKKTCEKQLVELERIIELGEDFLEGAPEGSLRISRCRNTDQYYWKKDGEDPKGKYIKRSQIGLVKSLAQKQYLTKVLTIAKQQYKQVKKSQVNCDLKEIDQLYNVMLSSKQRLITPVLVSDDVYAEEWLRKCQDSMTNNKLQNKFKWKYELDDDEGIITEQGEMVRSKSEKILADKLYMMGIPYVYEMPLYIAGVGYIHPDFTLLNKRTRKVYYWEHLGMMDVEEYCDKAIKKIELYEKNGVFQGRSLIVTYETKNHAPNTKALERLIEEFLI